MIARSYIITAVVTSLAAIFLAAGMVINYPTLDLFSMSLKPGPDHPLGTSPTGIDLKELSGVLLLRTASEAIWATSLTTVIGLAVGVIAAFRKGGIFDRIQLLLGRLLDSIGLLIALCIGSIFPEIGFWQLGILLAFVFWPAVATVTRGEILAIWDLPYVEAGRSLGLSNFRLATRYLLPPAMERLTPLAFGLFTGFVAVYGGLSFLGVGVTSEPGLGFAIFDSISYLRTAPWYFCVTTLSFLLLQVLAIAALESYKFLNKVEFTSQTM